MVVDRLEGENCLRRWPDRVGEVLGYDEERGWILLTSRPCGAHSC